MVVDSARKVPPAANSPSCFKDRLLKREDCVSRELSRGCDVGGATIDSGAGTGGDGVGSDGVPSDGVAADSGAGLDADQKKNITGSPGLEGSPGEVVPQN